MNDNNYATLLHWSLTTTKIKKKKEKKRDGDSRRQNIDLPLPSDSTPLYGQNVLVSPRGEGKAGSGAVYRIAHGPAVPGGCVTAPTAVCQRSTAALSGDNGRRRAVRSVIAGESQITEHLRWRRRRGK